jgi:hypothetical protein
MSRSGYSEDCEQWDMIRWRGAVNSAIKGARGQAFLKEMLQALDALGEHKLIAEELEKDGEVCGIGSVGRSRGIDMTNIDPTDREGIAEVFGIAPALAAEVMWMNDEAWGSYNETPEHRFDRMRKWIEEQIVSPPASVG